ncbi:hypothetical protein CMUS01_00554 [Colletotrichum musicola]|uniref:Uncharacterized protein n=1 Tax=Colletotrichum musicola TaxID=2175873 RepID=A0A8H6U9C4_9PEZI|nr:hypothetical protein CMUS01_00554 [Colletotrichum musicola]
MVQSLTQLGSPSALTSLPAAIQPYQERRAGREQGTASSSKDGKVGLEVRQVSDLRDDDDDDGNHIISRISFTSTIVGPSILVKAFQESFCLISAGAV